jgi:hypothetical protein
MTVSQNSANRRHTQAQQEALGGPLVEPVQVVMTLAVNPRNLAVLRVTEGTTPQTFIHRPPHQTPGVMLDLARSVVRDHDPRHHP